MKQTILDLINTYYSLKPVIKKVKRLQDGTTIMSTQRASVAWQIETLEGNGYDDEKAKSLIDETKDRISRELLSITENALMSIGQHEKPQETLDTPDKRVHWSVLMLFKSKIIKPYDYDILQPIIGSDGILLGMKRMNEANTNEK